jgi:hypothetical protein
MNRCCALCKVLHAAGAACHGQPKRHAIISQQHNCTTVLFPYYWSLAPTAITDSSAVVLLLVLLVLLPLLLLVLLPLLLLVLLPVLPLVLRPVLPLPLTVCCQLLCHGWPSG